MLHLNRPPIPIIVGKLQLPFAYTGPTHVSFATELDAFSVVTPTIQRTLFTSLTLNGYFSLKLFIRQSLRVAYLLWPRFQSLNFISKGSVRNSYSVASVASVIVLITSRQSFSSKSLLIDGALSYQEAVSGPAFNSFDTKYLFCLIKKSYIDDHSILIKFARVHEMSNL